MAVRTQTNALAAKQCSGIVNGLRRLLSDWHVGDIVVVLETLLRVFGLAASVRVVGQWPLRQLYGCDVSVWLGGGNEDAVKCCLVCSFVDVIFGWALELIIGIAIYYFGLRAQAGSSNREKTQNFRVPKKKGGLSHNTARPAKQNPTHTHS